VQLERSVTRAQAKVQGATGAQLSQALAGYRGASDHAVPTDKASRALTSLVQLEVLREAVAQRGGKVTDADRDTARQTVTSSLQNQGVNADDLPTEWVDQQVEFAATQTALQSLIKVPAKDLQAAYDAQIDDYTQICVSLILTADEDSADAARQRVLDGEAFADVAKDVSTDTTTSADGGVAGCAATADVAASLGDEVRGAELNVPLVPKAVQGGFVVTEITSRTVPELDDIADELTPDLQAPLVAKVVQPILDDVDVDARYGTWAASSASVVAPAAASSTTTAASGS